jgi:hypothetical protein
MARHTPQNIADAAARMRQAFDEAGRELAAIAEAPLSVAA